MAGLHAGAVTPPSHPPHPPPRQFDRNPPWKGTRCLNWHRPHAPQVPPPQPQRGPRAPPGPLFGMRVVMVLRSGSCRLSPQPALFLLQSGKDKDAIDKVFKNLDENSDSQVDFKEFVIFVAALTCCCHKYFEQKAAK